MRILWLFVARNSFVITASTPLRDTLLLRNPAVRRRLQRVSGGNYNSKHVAGGFRAHTGPSLFILANFGSRPGADVGAFLLRKMMPDLQPISRAFQFTFYVAGPHALPEIHLTGQQADFLAPRP